MAPATVHQYTCTPSASYTDLPDVEHCEREEGQTTTTPGNSTPNSPMMRSPAKARMRKNSPHYPATGPERYRNQQLTTPEECVALLNSPTSHFHTGLCKSDGLPWSEVMDYEYTKEHTITDLVLLKSFLLSGTTVTLIEEKILSWPPDSDHDQGATIPKLDKKAGGKDKEKDKARSSSRGSKAGSKSKKKKENVDDLRHDPPVVRTLRSVVMPLESLVSGEGQTYHVCNFGILITDTEQHDKAPRDGKKHKEQKLQSGLESTETHKTPRSSAKEKHNDSTINSTEYEAQSAPAMPVTAEITVRLLH